VISCDENFPVITCFSATVFINILPDRPNISVPDGFSPNGDGVNDEWVIPGIEHFPNNELLIFNRWGNKIREFTGYANQWAGTNADEEHLPDGTYYYVLKLNDEAETTFSGYVVIHR